MATERETDRTGYYVAGGLLLLGLLGVGFGVAGRGAKTLPGGGKPTKPTPSGGGEPDPYECGEDRTTWESRVKGDYWVETDGAPFRVESVGPCDVVRIDTTEASQGGATKAINAARYAVGPKGFVVYWEETPADATTITGRRRPQVKVEGRMMRRQRIRVVFDRRHAPAVKQHARRLLAAPRFKNAGRYFAVEADELDELGKRGAKDLADDYNLPVLRIVEY